MSAGAAMSLTPGTRLGPYEIASALGAGGMGEVYRARDTRLERTVAIKVLPAHLANDPERRQRFEREARAISSLNHPHICTIHDIGSQEGVDFIVLEYLEGESLEARLRKGPLPLAETLRLAAQVAGALDGAHRRGVVHRDLKPGNIMLTASGAKLLDFGLAKVAAPVSAGAPTETAPLTAAGAVFGTFQYMAPEQLEGKEADARTDVFAFGAVLYEMLAGRRAFEASSPASLIAAILDREPPSLSVSQPLVPPVLDRVVRKCLAKDPDARWQSARDLRDELLWSAEAPAAAAEPSSAAKGSRRREVAAWGIAAAAVIAAAVLAVLWQPGRAPAARRIELSLLPADGTSVRFVSLSPDGERLALVATDASERRRLYVRPLAAATAQPLAGIEGAETPFWSPDGRFIGFFAGGKLWKVEATGGTPQTICAAGDDAMGGSWSRDGVILFGSERGPIRRVPAGGGEPQPVTRIESHNVARHCWPWFLPDDRHFLYFESVSTGQAKNAIYVGTLDSKEAVRLVDADANMAFASGHLLFVRERELLAQPFDTTALRLSGDAVRLAQRMEFWPPAAYAYFTVSSSGVLCYDGQPRRRQLVWYDPSGRKLGDVSTPADYMTDFQMSPDERRVAARRVDERARSQVWIIDLQRGTGSPLGAGGFPLWSPDSRRVMHMWNPEGPEDFYVRPATGEGADEPVYRSEVLHKHLHDWSRDGRFLLYDTGNALWALPLEPQQQKPSKVVDGVAFQSQFSPDGKWIAYAGADSGRSEVYVRPFPGPGGRTQVSTRGGIQPRWRGDGREIFFLNEEGDLEAVEVKLSPSGADPGTSKVLFRPPLTERARSAGLRDYAVTRDGQRFLFLVPAGDSKHALTVVLDWAAGLGRK
jgi:Tol biopolymer transport system component